MRPRQLQHPTTPSDQEGARAGNLPHIRKIDLPLYGVNQSHIYTHTRIHTQRAFDKMLTQSYYEGEGLYQPLYDQVYKSFPRNPSKFNTDEHQQIFAFVAAIYKAYHDEAMTPREFCIDYGARYYIPKDVLSLIYTYLKSAKTCINTSLDKLLDTVILHAFYKKNRSHLINKLKLLIAFENVLW